MSQQFKNCKPPQKVISRRNSVATSTGFRRRVAINRSKPLPLLTIAIVSLSAGLLAGFVWNAFAAAQTVVPDPAKSPGSPTVIPTAEPSPLPTPTVIPTPIPTPTPVSTPRSITIKAVGDIVLGTNYPKNLLPPNQGKTLFQHVKPLLIGADILFGNFESTLTNHPKSAKRVLPNGRSFAFRTPPAYAERLKDAGFKVLSVANNHSMDFFEKGFEDTIAALRRFGMSATGKKGQITYLTLRGKKIAFIGFSYLDYHNSIHDLTAAQNLVKVASQNAAIVIVSFHAGAEGQKAARTPNTNEFFYGENRGNLIRFSRGVVDAGADLVLGHGPHVVRAMELYQNRLIAYSLGNFVGYQTLSTAGILSNSLVLQVELDRQGSFLSGKIIPVYLDADGIPRPDPKARTIAQVQQLTRLDFPATPLVIDRKGQLLKRSAR